MSNIRSIHLADDSSASSCRIRSACAAITSDLSFMTPCKVAMVSMRMSRLAVMLEGLKSISPLPRISHSADTSGKVSNIASIVSILTFLRPLSCLSKVGWLILHFIEKPLTDNPRLSTRCLSRLVIAPVSTIKYC